MELWRYKNCVNMLTAEVWPATTRTEKLARIFIYPPSKKPNEQKCWKLQHSWTNVCVRYFLLPIYFILLLYQRQYLSTPFFWKITHTHTCLNNYLCHPKIVNKIIQPSNSQLAFHDNVHTFLQTIAKKRNK